MSGSSGSAIVLHNVTLAYDDHPAVHDLSGEFSRGSLTAIVGPNGAGKSTLIKGMAGLLRPVEGLIQSAGLGGGGIAYLPQHAEIEKRFPISVIQTVLLGHWRRIGWARPMTRELRKGARRALGAVGLAGFERRPIEILSAGRFQRVLFARLIVQDAELILLDEPLAAGRLAHDARICCASSWAGRERGEPLQNSSGQVSIWEMNGTDRGRPRRTWQPRPYLAHLIEPQPLKISGRHTRSAASYPAALAEKSEGSNP